MTEMENSKLEKVNCNLCGSDNYNVRYIKDGYNIVQCNVCEMVYINPRLSPQAISDLYHEDYFHGKGFDKSIEYKEEFERLSKQTELSDWDVAAIKELLKTETSDSKPNLLDIGCGMGLFLWKAKNAGFNVEGIELSSYAADFVESLDIKIIGKSIYDTTLKEESYDAIVMKEVIEHLPNPRLALEKIYKALKKGGLLFMTTGNYGSPERKLKGKNWFYFMPEGHIYIFSNRTMKKYLSEIGFSNVSVTNQGDLLMNILLKYNIIEVNRFKPKNILKRIAFEKTRFINHFISSGMRIYAIK